MKYSIKKRGAILWQTGFTIDQIKAKFAEQKDHGDWLICPLGESADAIEMSQFFQSPSYFDQLAEIQRQASMVKSKDLQPDEIQGAILKVLQGIHSWLIFIGVVAVIQVLIWIYKLVS